ncbi:FxDxF family PEP-CTERM protein [Aquabacterium sp.]|uniref:FxDxF family PEP-CTERM protein n=1 Tax=Aquabacterium sp. TaxID=1872578 RepID=UPI0035B1C7B4
MKYVSRLAAIAAFSTLAVAAQSAVAATDLGTLGNAYTVFGNNYGSPQASFTDYYTFNIASTGVVAGGTIELDFGNLYNLNVNSITLSGGTLGGAGSLIDLNPNDGFAFSGLGVGSYQMAISGSVTGLLGGAYLGAVHAVTAPVPEPEHYAMALLGIAGIGWMVRRARAKAQA